MFEKQDVQGETASYTYPIHRVGITGLAFSGSIKVGQQITSLAGEIDCLAYLSEEKRGTHMSRMVRAINQLIEQPLTFELLRDTLLDLQKNLETKACEFRIRSSFILKKKAPITDNIGYEKYGLDIVVNEEDGDYIQSNTLKILGTSLCPASKKNSKYGAHSQRSLIEVQYNGELQISDYMTTIDTCFSSPIFPLLKLEDEKMVTETAYENAKFVEDIVRETAKKLTAANLKYQSIKCTNYESIHSHNAFAVVHYE